jgi:hypothetical protein
MAIKLDNKTPGVVGIIFGAGLSLALGCLLGLVHLAAKPVEVVSSLPKEPVEGAVYFVQGAPGSSSVTWERKFTQVETGSGEVGFGESDLNAWSTVTFVEPKTEAGKEPPSFSIVAGRPNFRLVGTELQIGAINKFNLFGTEVPLVTQVRGAWVKSRDAWTLRPSESMLGGLPLHRVPALEALVAKHFGVKEAIPEKAKSILSRASQISVAGGELVVRMP